MAAQAARLRGLSIARPRQYEEATAAYVTGQGVRRTAAYKPVLVYDEAVVFDVPKELVGQFTLRSTDGSLSLPLPLRVADAPTLRR